MNPSASGWIKIHLPVFKKEILIPQYTKIEFYKQLRAVGFIYANSIKTISYPEGTTYKLTIEECSKINLMDALGYAYFEFHPKGELHNFVKKTIEFYSYLKKNSWFNFKIPLFKSTPEAQLEKILDRRIKTNQSVFEKNFSSLVANALLYLDVLIFRHYLKTQKDPLPYAKSLEAILANTMYIALSLKSDQDEQDQLVLKMMEASIRYNKIDDISLSFGDLNYKKHKLQLECLYIMDLASMTVYADDILEDSEREFIDSLSQQLSFDHKTQLDCAGSAQTFISDNKDRITFLDDSKPFRNLYDNTAQTVRNLVLRNKKRLNEEIRQSGELMSLLRKSTRQDLTPEERKKVKTQLLDICKVIPSLAVFALPGGSILLPILIKFIPNILPSAFTDNKGS